MATLPVTQKLKGGLSGVRDLLRSQLLSGRKGVQSGSRVWISQGEHAYTGYTLSIWEMLAWGWGVWSQAGLHETLTQNKTTAKSDPVLLMTHLIAQGYIQRLLFLRSLYHQCTHDFDYKIKISSIKKTWTFFKLYRRLIWRYTCAK